MTTAIDSNQPTSPRDYSVVLFYKYFLPSEFPWIQLNPRHCETVILSFLRDTCQRLQLTGRLLVAAEGVNGTLSAPNRASIDEFIHVLEQYEVPHNDADNESIGTCPSSPSDGVKPDRLLFTGIDWKHSSSFVEPFPDLKVVITREIISSGDALGVQDIELFGGRHLDPSEFHRVLQEDPNVVLVDVRNPIEYEIGRFIHPSTTAHAINPSMVTFASFDLGFCAKQAEALKDKKVLMYCTGGIRCEKASAMLRRRGVDDVYQLKGGIHRYLEEYGNEGYFRGLNFVFDRRVAMSGSETKMEEPKDAVDVIGRCFECNSPFDEVSGSIICTVCRDICLVCLDCRARLREYHCRRHSSWKKCYFTFLEAFSRNELELQLEQLVEIREQASSSVQKMKNVRKTLTKQIEKVTDRIAKQDTHEVMAKKDAPWRCRSCFEPVSKCDGCCWGPSSGN
jgi:predicted sulfurtransferase